MKIKIKITKPRNPFVAALAFRKAGKHKKSNKQIRAGLRSTTRA